MAMAIAITAKSWRTAALARHEERRVSDWTTSLGNALRKSSLNSSPFTSFSFLDSAQQDVFDLEILVHAVLRALAAQTRLLDAAEWRHLGGDDADVRTDNSGFHL